MGDSIRYRASQNDFGLGDIVHWATVITSVISLLVIGSTPASAQFYPYPGGYGYYRLPNRYNGYSPPQYKHAHFRPNHSDRLRPKLASLPKEPFGKISTGPLQIVISLDRQRLSLFSDGILIAQSPVSTGVRRHPTPTGIFSVIQKQLFHRSNLYSDAPMPYMQRITWSGVAIHEGVLPGHPASHGCIRLPRDFAIRLYSLTRLGARVIISREDLAPIEFEHPNLFIRKEPSSQFLVSADPPLSQPAGNNILPLAEDTVQTPPSGAIVPAVNTGDQKPVRNNPITIFISRKEGKLYVRQGFEPVFSAPIVIHDPEKPFGTHLFTAMDRKSNLGDMRWTVISMAGPQPTVAATYEHQSNASAVRSASEALDRLELSKDVTDRIDTMLTPGSSVIVSDRGISSETGPGTDFVILMH